MKRFAIVLATGLLVLPSCNFVKISDKFYESIELETKDGKSELASETLKTKSFQISDFTELVTGINCTINYTQGDPSFEISAPENLVDCLVVEVKDGCLTIRSTRKIKNLRNKNSVINLSSTSVENVRIMGASDFIAENGLNTDRFQLVVDGSGDVVLDSLVAGELDITVNGAGDVTVSESKVDNVDIEINGAGDIKLREIGTVSAGITVSGAGDIDVSGLDCSGKLFVTVSGAGDCTLSGKSHRASLKLEGAGVIDARNLQVEDLETNTKGLGKIKVR